MCVDERRKLVLPWNMAYGKTGNRKLGVPPQADVLFNVELVGVSERPARGFAHLVPAGQDDEQDRETDEL
jgi:hypothetical protein